jgi:hypothetical protein
MDVVFGYLYQSSHDSMSSRSGTASMSLKTRPGLSKVSFF